MYLYVYISFCFEDITFSSDSNDISLHILYPVNTAIIKDMEVGSEKNVLLVDHTVSLKTNIV